ncbi:DUF6479 family protein [Streptomyces sp. SM14]|uniref:DUF6479 family protein n=1 Tax=Streptomyces sp. SM14 TaxID=1736045 RepID=UPI000CD50D3A|nr:DUF6479 family protein [Streptomyces sp. SM14]
MDGSMHGSTVRIAAERDFLVGVGPFVLGIVLVTLLIAAVWYGIRLRQRELPAPRPEEQPGLPPEGPVGEVMEHPAHPGFEPDGRRLRPHELQPFGSTPGVPADRGAPSPEGPRATATAKDADPTGTSAERSGPDADGAGARDRG